MSSEACLRIKTNLLRFLTLSIHGLNVAEDMCETPIKCLSVIFTEEKSTNTSFQILQMKEPKYLVNILKVSGHFPKFLFSSSTYLYCWVAFAELGLTVLILSVA